MTDQDDQPETAPRVVPHHAGHRERLRKRARTAGLHHLPDYELLELFLFRSQPHGDMKPIAKALLARFSYTRHSTGANGPIPKSLIALWY